MLTFPIKGVDLRNAITANLGRIEKQASEDAEFAKKERELFSARYQMPPEPPHPALLAGPSKEDVMVSVLKFTADRLDDAKTYDLSLGECCALGLVEGASAIGFRGFMLT